MEESDDYEWQSWPNLPFSIVVVENREEAGSWNWWQFYWFESNDSLLLSPSKLLVWLVTRGTSLSVSYELRFIQYPDSFHHERIVIFFVPQDVPNSTIHGTNPSVYGHGTCNGNVLYYFFKRVVRLVSACLFDICLGVFAAVEWFKKKRNAIINRPRAMKLNNHFVLILFEVSMWFRNFFLRPGKPEVWARLMIVWKVLEHLVKQRLFNDSNQSYFISCSSQVNQTMIIYWQQSVITKILVMYVVKVKCQKLLKHTTSS